MFGAGPQRDCSSQVSTGSARHSIAPSSSHSSAPSQSQELVVKNTFLTVIETPPGSHHRLSRSHSDSEIDGSSSSAYGGRGDGGGATDSGTEREEVAEQAGISETDESNHPSDSAPPLWSKGSALHESGQCKPCLYVGTKSGCINGTECGFCHAGHRRSRPRPSKSTRTKCKQIVAQMGARDGATEGGDADALAEYSPYIRSLLRGKLTDETPAPREGAPASSSSAGQSSASSSSARASAPRAAPRIPGPSQAGYPSAGFASSSSAHPVPPVPAKAAPTRPRKLKMSL